MEIRKYFERAAVTVFSRVSDSTFEFVERRYGGSKTVRRAREERDILSERRRIYAETGSVDSGFVRKGYEATMKEVAYDAKKGFQWLLSREFLSSIVRYIAGVLPESSFEGTDAYKRIVDNAKTRLRKVYGRAVRRADRKAYEDFSAIERRLEARTGEAEKRAKYFESQNDMLRGATKASEARLREIVRNPVAVGLKAVEYVEPGQRLADMRVIALDENGDIIYTTPGFRTAYGLWHDIVGQRLPEISDRIKKRELRHDKIEVRIGKRNHRVELIPRTETIGDIGAVTFIQFEDANPTVLERILSSRRVADGGKTFGEIFRNVKYLPRSESS